jgi:hypothetical protein
MYLVFIDAVDHPMTSTTVLSGTPRMSRTVAAVSRIVKPRIPYTGLAEQVLPVVVVTARVDRLPVGLGEHPTAIMPLGPRVLAHVAKVHHGVVLGFSVSVRRGELIFAWVGGTVTGVDAGVVVSPEQVSLGAGECGAMGRGR